jgi:hypothetical protein
VPRCGTWLYFVSLIGGLAAAMPCAWLAQRGLPAPWLFPGAAFVAVASIVLRRARVGSGLLAWDGAQWRWQGLDGELRVAMDLGPVLLLCFEPAGEAPRTWMSVSTRSAGGAWHGLRAAVYFCRPDANAHTQNDSALRT